MPQGCPQGANPRTINSSQSCNDPVLTSAPLYKTMDHLSPSQSNGLCKAPLLKTNPFARGAQNLWDPSTQVVHHLYQLSSCRTFGCPQLATKPNPQPTTTEIAKFNHSIERCPIMWL